MSQVVYLVYKHTAPKGHIKTNAHKAAISKAAKERWEEFRSNKNE